MSFEFLAPDQAQAAPGGAPALRSPIEWAHLDAGAKLGERAGWSYVRDYGDPAREAAACREAVGVADLSYMGKIEVQARPADLAQIVSGLAGGATLELGMATDHDGVWWCPITADRVLAITRPEDTARIRQSMEDAASRSSSFASVTELTSALGSNAVTGPLAREAFARATALDMRPDRFPERSFAPVSVARTPAMVLREGGDRFLHLFGSGYSQYVWTVFADAAEGLGGRPVGAEALEAGQEVEVGAGA